MKLFAGIAISTITLFGSGELKRPEPFFQQGNEITYSESTFMRGSGSMRSSSVIHVESVVSNAGSVSSLCRMNYYDEHQKLVKSYRMRFAVDSSVFYAHATNWMYESFEPTESYLYTGDSLWYPLNMKVGDSLRDAWALSEINSNGVKGFTKSEFKNRKVVSLDSLTIAKTKVAAYQIEMHVVGTSKTDDQYNGNVRNVIEYDITEWFSPELGIVKSVYDTGISDSRIVMESYKK